MTTAEATAALETAGFKLQPSGNDLVILSAHPQLGLNNAPGMLKTQDNRLVDILKTHYNEKSTPNLETFVSALAEAATTFEHEGNGQCILRRGSNPFCDPPGCSDVVIELICGGKKLLIEHMKATVGTQSLDSIFLTEAPAVRINSRQ
jgi:hypothetical protein